ncbi:hypothetical protein ABZ614_31715 [Streptomyces sp. NPDC013178]|uniref:hypothetical protein n=1 Tax=unclassified Streptomyces TaxID=2593676 RepID=UPI0033E74E39
MLAVAFAAGYGWYQISDTGKGWRYEDKLATYCDGLIPYNESAVFTGLNTEVGLQSDKHYGYGSHGYNYCKVADMALTITLVPDDAVGSGSGASVVFKELQASPSDNVPVALGGGWYGYTDLRNTSVVLPCNNKSASVVVSIDGDESHENPSEARAMGELAAATARNAADRWSCKSNYGGRISKISSAPTEQRSAGAATKSCKSIPTPEDEGIDWIKESDASGTTPLEECVLGESKARDEPLYYLKASFGPYAQGLRSTTDEPDALNADTGVSRHQAWATAACPGASRAVFSIYATEYADPQQSFLLSALRAFAEQSAVRHGCTDVKLPR